MNTPTQLTVRGVDNDLYVALKEGAEEAGVSVNKFVVKLLRKGTDLDELPPRHRDLDWMVGLWTEEEADEFDQVIRDQRQIDHEMWD